MKIRTNNLSLNILIFVGGGAAIYLVILFIKTIWQLLFLWLITSISLG